MWVYFAVDLVLRLAKSEAVTNNTLAFDYLLPTTGQIEDLLSSLIPERNRYTYVTFRRRIKYKSSEPSFHMKSQFTALRMRYIICCTIFLQACKMNDRNTLDISLRQPRAESVLTWYPHATSLNNTDLLFRRSLHVKKHAIFPTMAILLMPGHLLCTSHLVPNLLTHL